MVSPAMSCVKYLLFVFNLIFAISGIVILVTGAIAQGTYSDFQHFLDEKFVTTPVILIVVGVITFFVAFFGCCGAAKESHCMISTFAVLLLVLFVAELAGGITAYLLRDDVQDVVNTRLRDTLNSYNNDTDIRHGWDILQHDLECCGADGPTDWKQAIPSSCCLRNIPGEMCSLDDAFRDGCLLKLQNLLEKNAVVIGGIGIGIAFIQLLGVIFACCLSRSIQKDYESV